MFTRAILTKHPSGRFGFVGRVPAALAFVRKDGAPMTAEDYERASHANAPGLLGYTSRTFATREDAEKAATDIGVEYDVQGV